MRDANITDTGCYLDNHRGHYIDARRDRACGRVRLHHRPVREVRGRVCTRSTIDDEDFPHEGMHRAVRRGYRRGSTAGRVSAPSVLALAGSRSAITRRVVHAQGSPGREALLQAALALAGVTASTVQNFPPRIPEGFVWEFNDGDFGLCTRSTRRTKHA